MANFGPALDFMMDHEDRNRTGTIAKEPAGGVAKYGINSKAHPEVDVPNLTFEQAVELYEKWYWRPIHGDVIKDQLVANKLLDVAVNLGTAWAGKAVQRSLPPLVVDGAIGPKTIQAINASDPTTLVLAIRQQQIDHYKERAAEDPRIAAILSALLKRASA